MEVTLLTSLIPSSLVPRDLSERGIWEEVTRPLAHSGVPLGDKSAPPAHAKRDLLCRHGLWFSGSGTRC